MAKSNTISLRNFKQLDAILASSFRKRDAGKLLYQSVNDGARIVRKAIREEVKPSTEKTKKTPANGGQSWERKFQPHGTLRRSVKSGLRRKGFGKNPNLFAAAVSTNEDGTYSKKDGWYAHMVHFGTKSGIKANPFMDKGFAKSKKAAELQIKFGIYKRVKQLQQKINMLR
tara:strand:- start:231 stop:743 length:513 start_codon:yes stop_codon:yes gene_type:complete